MLIGCTTALTLVGETQTPLDSEEVEFVGEAPGVSFTISPPGGTFTDSMEVSLDFEGAEPDIYYTLDGSKPDDRDEHYEGPILLDSSAQVRAIATNRHGDPIGGALSQSYVRLDSELEDFSSNLPLLVLSSDESVPGSRADHTPFALHVFEPDESGRAGLVGRADLDQRLGLKVRGSSTASLPKHSFGLEAWDAEEDSDHSVSLLGMPAESDWVLLAPLAFDRAFMRNALIYQLSNDIGRYAPRSRFVEVFAVGNGSALGEGDYLGVYVLLERVKRADERVDLKTLDPEDIDEPKVTGGYLFKEDRLADGESGFTAGTADGAFDFEQNFVWVDPKEDDIVWQQDQYLRFFLDDFAAALSADDFTHPEDGTHYSEYIDRAAWIDHHILNTFAKNPDAFRLSGYLHKDREGPLVAGPLWDFDRTMGCAEDWRPYDPTWWDPSNLTSDTTFLFDHGFWRGLFRDPEFQQAYWARWSELLDDELSPERVRARVELMATQLEEAAERNFARWPDYPPRGGSYRAEVDLLLEWLEIRNAWISACVATEQPLACTGN